MRATGHAESYFCLSPLNYLSHVVNVALTLMSILLKFACISISWTTKFVIVRARSSPEYVCRFICRSVLHANTHTDHFETRSTVNLKIMTEVMHALLDTR